MFRHMTYNGSEWIDGGGDLSPITELYSGARGSLP